MMKFRTCFLSAILLVFTSLPLFSQSYEVKGKVCDDQNLPLPGAIVMDQSNSKNVAVTNDQGMFSLKVARNAVLEISMMGYKTQTLTMDGRGKINVVMELDSQILETAVAIGYGTAMKSDLTGAVGVVDMKQIQDVPASNVAQMLQGQVTGLEISSGSGEVGESMKIQMRGTRSLSAGNAPLIVVDGIMDAVTDLSELNPSDIVSISVLKDVSSTAIYGSRGANGVILVTTDTKKDDDMKVSAVIKSVTGISQIAGSLDLMDATDFARWQNMIKLQNNGLDTVPQGMGTSYPFADPTVVGKGTDWVRLLSQTGVYNDQYAQLKINTKNTVISASLGYNYTRGVVIGSAYNRYTGRISTDTKLSKVVRLGVRASYIYYDVKRTGASVTGTGSNAAIYLNPLLDKDATFNRYGVDYSEGSIFDNPYLRAKHVTNVADKWILNIAPWVELSFKHGLSLKSTFSFAHENHNTDRYSPSYMAVAQAAQSGAFASRAYDEYLRFNSETTLSWKYSRKKNNLEVLGGFVAGQNVTQKAVYYGTGYIDDVVKYYDMSAIVNPANFLGSSSYYKKTYMSVLGRLSYNYDKKYYAILTLRTDGASNFSPSRKWGLFPAASFRWSIFNEDFMRDVRWIDDLSLRASIGRSGNDAISSYLSQAIINPDPGTWVFGQQHKLSAYQSRIENSNLTWETTDALNLGLNVAMLKSRISVEADFYYSKTRDLLMSAKLSQTTGFSSYFCNMGDTENMGVEVKINTKNIRKSRFTWNTSLTLSHNNQIVTDSAAGDEVVPVYMNPGNPTQYLYGYKTGYPVNALWGYKYGGVWHNQEELDRNNYTHAYASTIKDGANGTNVGRARYYDIDGDGNLNENDVVYLGSTDPIIYGGFGNEFKFFNRLSLNVYFTYSLGGRMYNISELRLGSTSAYNNHYRYVLDAWHPTRNPNSNIPKPGYEDALASDRFVHDASYLRLKTLSLSYNFNLAKHSKVFKTFKMGVTAENLFLLKNYNGFDPDVASGETIRKIDSGSFPRSRTYTVNFQLNF